MAGKQSRLPKIITSEKVDDLKLIRGIGAARAGYLHEAGIHTYAQLASLSPAELANQVIGLSASQISRQNWIGQARSLSRKKVRNTARRKVTTPTVRQHYQNFTVEFLLDKKNTIRRTRIIHIQSGDENIWPGWEAKQLLDFLARYAGEQIQLTTLASQEVIIAQNNLLLNKIGESNQLGLQTPENHSSLSVPAETSLLVHRLTENNSQAPAISRPERILQLNNLRVLLINSSTPIFFLRQGQLYIVELTFDCTQMVVSNNSTLLAIVIAKQLNGPHRTFVEAKSTLKLSNTVLVHIVGASLLPGLYYLNAYASLAYDDAAPSLTASLKSVLLQVY